MENYDLWLQYARKHLVEQVISWPAMREMVEMICNPSSDAERARSLLRKYYLPSGISPVSLYTPDSPYKNFLAVAGAVLYGEHSTFIISSPLVHKLLLERAVIKDMRRNIPKTGVPYIKEGTSVDVVNLVESAVACIDPLAVQRGCRASWKRTTLPGLKRVCILPKETVYQIELYSILRQWFSDEVEINTQVNLPSEDSYSQCEIIIEPSVVSRIVIELVTNVPPSILKEHYSRAIEYGKRLNATEVWVIHFTIKVDGEDFQYPWPQDEASNVIHVWHSADFSSFRIFCNKK